MEERMAETNSNVDSSAQPSVAQLAGRFREQAAVAREKSPSNTSHPPKIKVKSSPLIEKLQANLAFDPAALLPGASPKSPGLKAMVSPFHSPPSTPSSPGIRSQPEAEEVPVSFDQPPEGTHLPSYNKMLRPQTRAPRSALSSTANASHTELSPQIINRWTAFISS